MVENSHELISRAQNNDPAAFGELYSDIWRDLYRFALYCLQNREDAEDAVQETAIEAFKSINKLHDPAAFKSWIFTILSCRCRRRRQDFFKTKQNTTMEELEQAGIFVISDSDKYDEKLAVWNALDKLKNDEKIIVLLSVVGDYSSSEISKALKRPSGTIRSKLQRSLQKLRVILNEN